jgi:hypothetical protein
MLAAFSLIRKAEVFIVTLELPFYVKKPTNLPRRWVGMPHRAHIHIGRDDIG